MQGRQAPAQQSHRPLTDKAGGHTPPGPGDGHSLCCKGTSRVPALFSLMRGSNSCIYVEAISVSYCVPHALKTIW